VPIFSFPSLATLSSVLSSLAFSVPCAFSVFPHVEPFWCIIRLLSVQILFALVVFLVHLIPSLHFPYSLQSFCFSIRLPGLFVFSTQKIIPGFAHSGYSQFDRTDHISNEIHGHRSDEGCFSSCCEQNLMKVFTAVIPLRHP
jgi:hypothetical protein